MSNKVKLELSLGIGMNQFFPELVTVEFETNNDNELIKDGFGYTVISYCVNDGETEPHGVMVQVDNGDTQYLTMSEINKLNKRRKKDGNSK